jgi:hypothetical protein
METRRAPISSAVGAQFETWRMELCRRRSDPQGATGTLQEKDDGRVNSQSTCVGVAHPTQW